MSSVVTPRKQQWSNYKRLPWLLILPMRTRIRKLPPPPKSKHHLPKWQSLRPEAALEKTHKFLVHLANTGTNSELADIIIMGGIAEFNVQCRFKAMTNSCRLQGQKRTTPAHFEDIPPFSDHSLLSFINSEARRCGLPDLFSNVTPINPDNGEVFLAKYFEEQMVRNRTTGQDSITSMCLCADCSGSDEVIRNVPSKNDEEQQQEQQNSLVLVNQDQNSPVPIQPQNLIPFLNFNPTFYNTPRMVMPPTIDALWWSKPVDCCFNHPPWYCNKKQMHLNRIAQNGPVLG